MLPPLTWVKINCYINHKVVLVPILNDGPKWGLNHGPSVQQSPAPPSELSVIDSKMELQPSA